MFNRALRGYNLSFNRGIIFTSTSAYLEFNHSL
jgi:hypothetical protein